MPGVCVKDWLESALASFSLSEDAEGYLLGRGVTEAKYRDIGIGLWDSGAITTPAPDPAFCARKGGHGARGERLEGRLCTPIRSPRGALLGVEARTYTGDKRVTQYLLPEASWNPVFIGLTPTTMQKIWDGGDVWVVEGIYDMGALSHIVPSHDVVLATLRAHVSNQHAQFFRRFCRGYVNMVYDNDETGRKQTLGYVDAQTNKRRWGALDVLSRVGVRARDIPYRGGKDPGEIWERRGLTGLRAAFTNFI